MQAVAIYDHDNEVTRYVRCWRRGQTLGTERFEKELLEQRPAAQRSAAQRRLILFLGETGESYLRQLAETDRSLSRQIKELLIWCVNMAPDSVLAAIRKAHAAECFRRRLYRQYSCPGTICPEYSRCCV
jgi:hypothetical protein